jgi:poly(3-hydroxyalkanoate) synthetase
LANLDMPLTLMAGATDHITPPDQVFALTALAATPEEQVHRFLSTGGHLGLFMGHEALREHWPPLLAEVLRHSRGSSTRQRGGPRRNRAATAPSSPGPSSPGSR